MFSVTPESFNVNIVGSTTGQEYIGVWKVKPVLNAAEQILRDSIMRDLLGPNSKESSNRATSQAFLVAEIRVRTIEAPTFWQESNFGLLFLDEEVTATVYDQIQEIEKKWREEIKKKGEAAKAALKTQPEPK